MDVASPKKTAPVTWSRSMEPIEISEASTKILTEYRGKSSTDHLVRIYDPERSGKLAMNDFYLMMKDLFMNERELMLSFPPPNNDQPTSLFEVAFSYRSINRAIEKAMFEEVGLSRRLYESKCKNMYFTAELFWPILLLLNELGYIRTYKVDAPPRTAEEEAFFKETVELLKRLSGGDSNAPPLAVSLRVPQRIASKAFTPEEAKTELYKMDPSLVKMKIKGPISQLFRDVASSLHTPTGKPPAVDPALPGESSRSDKSPKTPQLQSGKHQVESALREVFAHYTFPHQMMSLNQLKRFVLDFEISGLSETQLADHFREAAKGTSVIGVDAFLDLVQQLASKIELPTPDQLLAGRTYLRMGLFSGNVCAC